jgi:hypothetical protein
VGGGKSGGGRNKDAEAQIVRKAAGPKVPQARSRSPFALRSSLYAFGPKGVAHQPPTCFAPGLPPVETIPPSCRISDESMASSIACKRASVTHWEPPGTLHLTHLTLLASSSTELLIFSTIPPVLGSLSFVSKCPFGSAELLIYPRTPYALLLVWLTLRL